MACTGSDYCNLALVKTKDMARKLAASLTTQHPQGLPATMHWPRCPAGCGNHLTANVNFQGGKARSNGRIVDAVSIFVGGRTGIDPKPGHKILDLVHVDKLDAVVPTILRNLYSLHHLLRDVERNPERNREKNRKAKPRVVMILAFPVGV